VRCDGALIDRARRTVPRIDRRRAVMTK
jgi:hypothetical protein